MATVTRLTRAAGSTSVIVEVFIEDSASAGNGKTGLAYNTGSLVAYYKRSNGTVSVSISLVTITTLGTFASGGFKEVDATNMPGLYEFHIPDAALASGAGTVSIMLKGASGMFPCIVEVQLGTELTTTERTAVADAILSRTLAAETYATDGSVPTLSQMLYMLWAAGAQFDISGTTITCRKLDGSTSAMTFTLDSSSTPTSRTRAS